VTGPVEFLEAAHKRAETVASALPKGPWQWAHHTDPEGGYHALENRVAAPVLRTRTWMREPVNHSSRIEMHPAFDAFLPDPETVLQRVAAERKILDEHANDGGDCRICADEATGDEDSEGNRDWYRSAKPSPCTTVRLLAEAWGWTEETP
jgi:hypothetical protein